ncbi:ATPase family AAA domain-containing protein 3B [Fusarium oxysporum f. sp. raphani]|uniref:ATPase family AAA domain-containing protein 3B n=1 Tax=Fusarium oxysporum f. sp. raphani TaxID=96318 RepID=A0A8J5QGD6_FUSOX|nr:ATPase family AAA domain-containing protein 3B [Fusarium oxysporum f. sp. raphani]
MDSHVSLNNPASSSPAPQSIAQIGAPSEATVPAPASVSQSLKDSQAQNAETEEPVAASNSVRRKKILLAVQILEDEVKELHNLLSDSVTTNLDRRLKLIKGLVEETNQNVGQIDDDGDQAKSKPQKENPAVVKSDQQDDELVCSVKRCSMASWPKEQPKPRHVIAAHYLSPVLINTTSEVRGAGKGNTDRQERPQRVELASDVLVHELEDIAGIDLETQASILLAPPYKLFIKYYDGICDRLLFLQNNIPPEGKKPDAPYEMTFPVSLETRTSTVATSKAESADDANRPKIQSSPEREPLERENDKSSNINDDASVKRKEWITRMDHLRLLKEFIDSELAPQLKIFAKANTSDLEKIAFEDLWLLFSAGDVVFFKDRGYDRLGRAYAVTGGQQRKRRDETRFNPFEDIKVKSTEGYAFNSTRGSWNSLTVNYYTMEYDGYYLGPNDACIHIRHYTGERNITDLPIFPLRFHKMKVEIERRLIERGKTYCSSYGHKSYSGTTCPSDNKESPEEIFGDMFVDFKDYYRMPPGWTPYDYRPRTTYPRSRPELGNIRPLESDPSETEEKISGDTEYHLYDKEVDDKSFDDFMISHLNELDVVKLETDQVPVESLLLLPHWVPAYFFRTRRYERVDVDNIRDIDKSDEARDSSFENLVILDSHRNLLLGLVRNLVVGSKSDTGPQGVGDGSTQIDIVRGKGRGLIILLHGPPGSGKTSTAETLAAYSRRPLYPITCGDLGTNPDVVERTLVEHTERAQRWGCVLLLDEADVFLSRRDWRDTNHNALVSVFLRQLEYYSGILFLTTNRVGVIDEAFKSRIHVSLAYPNIKLQETLHIWKGILNRLEKDNQTARIRVKFDRSALLSFAKRHYKSHESTNSTWNGRQIRNAFQLAISLGHHDRDQKLRAASLTDEQAIASGEKKWTSVRLTTANFDNIATTAREFEDYLQNTRGHDSEIAKNLSLRHDDDTEDIPASSPFNKMQKDYKGQSRSYLTPRHSSHERGTSRPSPGYGSGRLRVGGQRESTADSSRQRRNQEITDEQDSNEEDEEDEADIIDDISSDED